MSPSVVERNELIRRVSKQKKKAPKRRRRGSPSHQFSS